MPYIKHTELANFHKKCAVHDAMSNSANCPTDSGQSMISLGKRRNTEVILLQVVVECRHIAQPSSFIQIKPLKLINTACQCSSYAAERTEYSKYRRALRQRQHSGTHGEISLLLTVLYIFMIGTKQARLAPCACAARHGKVTLVRNHT